MFDVILSTRAFRRAAYRSFDQQRRLIFCSFEDHDLIVNPADLVGRTVLDQGSFDRPRTDLVSRRANELTGRKTVLEVGANIGTQTIYFLKSGLFDKVVCLEPDPRNTRMLELNLHLNRIGHQVVLLPVAAGAAPDTLLLHRDKGNSGGATLRAERLSQNYTPEVSVPVITLDSLFDDRIVRYDDVGLIWMDAEGFEEEIFLGAPALFSREIPLAFEFTPGFYNEQKARRIIDLVFKYYDTVSIVDDFGLMEITQSDMAKLKKQVDIFCSKQATL